MHKETQKWLITCCPTLVLLFFILVQLKDDQKLFTLTLSAIIVLILSVLYMSHRFREQNRIREAKKIKNLLVRMRHDWMNHVQVLMGYLTMNKVDHSKKYLQKMVHRAMRDRKIAEIEYPPLAMLLLTLEHQYSIWRCYISMGENLELSQKDQKDFYFILRIFFNWLAECAGKHPDWTDIYIEFSSDGQGVKFVVKRITEEGKLDSFAIEDHQWNELIQTLEPWEVDCQQKNTEKIYLQLLKRKRG